jgi:ADP-ribose pyrophosphatase YjhB (NUDIX family)
MSEREYPGRPVVGVGAVIVAEPGTAAALGWAPLEGQRGVVLVQRRYEPLAGRWSLPGGGLEVGETLAEGIAREVLEETALVVAVGPALDVFDRIMRDPDGRVQYHFVLVDYLCTVVSGRPRAGSDVTAVAVADPERLAPYDLTAKALEIIGKAIDHVV